MMSTGDLRLESASFSHDGGRDYNEDAVGDSDGHVDSCVSPGG